MRASVIVYKILTGRLLPFISVKSCEFMILFESDLGFLG